MPIQKITPFLWYVKEAEEAARFYVSVFPDSHIERTWKLEAESPSGPPGTVSVVDFSLSGQKFTAMSAGPLDPFNHAISFVVSCEDQAEVDRYWAALVEGGGTHEPCGWLKDRFGVCWQVVPAAHLEHMASADREGAARAAKAMLKMQKLDVAALQAAFEGR